MALPLESEVMTGQRWASARKLPDAIKTRHDAGEPIAAPHAPLVKLALEAAENLDLGEYTLTRTWQVCSEVIAAHIHAHGLKGADRTQFLARSAATIRHHYGLDPVPRRAQDWAKYGWSR
jgi:hypothetical protein